MKLLLTLIATVALFITIPVVAGVLTPENTTTTASTIPSKPITLPGSPNVQDAMTWEEIQHVPADATVTVEIH